LENGAKRRYGARTVADLNALRRRARSVAEPRGVAFVSAEQVNGWLADETRTTYLLDVRTPEEFAANGAPGFTHAPGGQLVQSTDQYVGTRNARLVLVDDDGVRARMTASWLLQLGWPEVYVLDPMRPGTAIETGPEPVEVLGLDTVKAQTIPAADLKQALDRNEVVVVDLDTSLRYRNGHIPGAWWAVRARLPTALTKLPAGKPVVFTSPDGTLARFAAGEAAAFAGVPVRALAGGTRAWRDAKLPVEPGAGRLADEPNDVWYKPYDHGTGVEGAMRAYLTWEVGLVEQIARDGDARFRVLAPVEPERA
jgi:rhodanese-related sulfurtransferase